MKYRLLAPGPTPVPDRVLLKMSHTLIHHRTPVFEAAFAEARKGLQWLMQTEYDVITLAASGTGTFEAAMQNFFSPGEQIITIGGGKFGERWGQMGRQLGLDVIEIDVDWGMAVTVEAVQSALDEYPNVKGVICVGSETSTGVRHPYEDLAKLVKDREDTIFLLDGITAVGVWDISPERDGIDVLVTGSQKALMLPPGLGFMAVSPKAWARNAKGTCPHYYFDLAKERKALQKGLGQTAYTPGVSLIIGLTEAIKMMQEEGLEAMFARHDRMARATRAGVDALGLKRLAEVPAASVTSVWAPEAIAKNAVVTGMRDRANITIAGGQDDLKGRIFRLAHLGYFDELDICTTLSALEIILRQEGYTDFEPGASIAAAQPILAEGFVAKGGDA